MSTSALHRELGLTDEELDDIRVQLGREPTYTELAMFSVMWSEHCSYKSSRIHLSSLPTEGPHILVGPGEGAGIVEVAPGTAVAWKVESHNHPSFVEPFSGAATGVGGIVRDILSMGARPIALLDSLRFGSLDNPRTRYLVEGVVSGISAYGNSIGVPTVGGEAIFDDSYAGNPLVNVACLGVVEDQLMHGRAEGRGNAVVLFGSSTGRDGIGGASVLASAEFDEGSAEKRPSVQVGDPFTEKLLIEASLELIRRRLIVAFQDLGAGGISCPTSEMAAKGGVGMEIDVGSVHRREPGMEPFEVMISESQERMMAIVRPDDVPEVISICGRWGLEARVIGRVTSEERLRITEDGDVLADVPPAALADEGPVYRRPHRRPDWLDTVQEAPAGGEPHDPRDALLKLLGSPSIASKRWIWEQYDHMIFLGTVVPPGSDAAVVRLPKSDVAVAISVDGPGRYCLLDPYEGARLAVAEAARNVACSGGRPLAVTNCLNFGNPEKPEVMWQFAEVVRGVGDAASALGTPVTGGNVSFYNETDGNAIHPTPVIGMLGVLPDPAAALSIAFPPGGLEILLLGRTDLQDFGGSEYSAVIDGVVAGRPPSLDLEDEIRLVDLLQAANAGGLVSSAHDVSEGGLGVALVECALAGGSGFGVVVPPGEMHRVLFSESPSRVVVACMPGDVQRLMDLADERGVQVARIGVTGGSELDFGSFSISLEDARSAHGEALGRALSDTMS